MNEADELEKKRQLEFVMKVGYQMKTFLNKCLIDAFKSHEEMSAAFYSTLINFVANTILEFSEPENFNNNLLGIIKGLQDWINRADMVRASYDPKTNKINKEDLH